MLLDIYYMFIRYTSQDELISLYTVVRNIQFELESEQNEEFKKRKNYQQQSDLLFGISILEKTFMNQQRYY